MSDRPDPTAARPGSADGGEGGLAPALLLARASAAYRGGQVAAAERLCRAVLDAQPAHFDALVLLALAEHAQGRSEAAGRLLDRAIEIDPRSAEALAIRGLVLRALGRGEEALASYDEALSIKPDFADALYNRGNVLQALGRGEEALASYDRALALVGLDAQALNNRGVVLHELGRHQEALDSLARALAVRPDYPEALNNRGNTLQALELHEQALASFDRALALRPDYAEAFNNRGNALHALDRLEEALASYARAITLRPDYAEAFNNRAAVLYGLGRHEEALASCDQALAIRPGYVEALNNRGKALQGLEQHEEALASYEAAYALEPDFGGALGIGNALQALGRYEEALARYEEALSMRPDHAGVLSNRGNALQALRRHDEALKSYARAIALKPSDAEAHWNEALSRLAMGDFERGWEKYEWRWQRRKPELPRRYRETPAWRGKQDVAGKTVLLYPEQGFGDAIQFIRYVPMVHELGARVLVACHRDLVDLFRTVDGLGAVLKPDDPLPAIDFCAALMSLPLAFGTTLSTIPSRVPYLHAAGERVARWSERLAPREGRVKVGLSWKGNPRFTAARAKACPVERLAPLLSSPGCAFFSLQKGEAAADVGRLAAAGCEVTDFTSELEGFADTAALIDALDLVITIDTAVAHLAGALGKPVWILLPFAADWRWLLDREDSPWYPTARLFRQPSVGDWGSVIRTAAGELARLGGRHASSGANA